MVHRCNKSGDYGTIFSVTGQHICRERTASIATTTGVKLSDVLPVGHQLRQFSPEESMFILRTQTDAVWKVKNYLHLPNFAVILKSFLVALSLYFSIFGLGCYLLCQTSSKPQVNSHPSIYIVQLNGHPNIPGTQCY